ncbi:MAG: gliding motility-associated C-terminal domain-containing protein [Bacteroidota bacterium]
MQFKLGMNITFMRAILLLFLFAPTLVFSQLETRFWHFGSQLGLDFAGTEPVELTNSEIFAIEGCASISDCEGNLLFYTNGGGTATGFTNGAIWNANNEIMYDMEGIEGGGLSASQSSIIFKKPGNNNAYYLFTMEEAEFDNDGGVPGQPQGRGLSYFEINMDLNGGLGGVTVADERVYVPAYEALTACLHDNEEDYWVIIAADDTNQFGVFLVTETGVVDTTFYQPLDTFQFGSNYFKVSPDRTKLFASGDLYDFDPATGTISNGQFINNGTYGASFSTNSQYLYTQGPGAGQIVQYDLNAPNISASQITVGVVNTDTPIPVGIQLALDSSIYCLTSDAFTTSDLYRIRDINGPNPSLEGPLFDNGQTFLPGFGLPNFTDHLFIKGESLEAPPLINPDITFLCPGDTIVLDALNPNANFSWSTGETTQTIAVTEPGIYSVDISNDCTQVFAEVTVETAPLPEAAIVASQATLCPDQSTTLSLVTNINGAADIFWSTGVNNELAIVIQEPGLYTATVENACGEESTAEINIELIDQAPTLTLSGPQEPFCEGDTITLVATAENASLIGWLDNVEQAEISVQEPGAYVAFAENACFQVEESIEVETRPCTNCLEVPNIFTPNQDNLNDHFTPLVNCEVAQYALTIYNRWGQEVFRTNQVDQAWDGTFQGVPQPMDVYAFILEVDFATDQVTDVKINGEVNLIR